MPAIDLSLAGIPLRIETSTDRLATLFIEYFRYHLTPPANGGGAAIPVSGEGRVEVRLELSEVARLPAEDSFVPAGASLITRAGVLGLWEEPRAAGGSIYHLHAGAAAYLIDPAGGKVTGLVGPDAFVMPEILANTWTLFPLLLLLRWRGCYHLHAAAVVSPRGGLWLICGSQRSGKTTLTTALGLAGWRPISDDSLFLGETDGGWRLEPLRRSFHLGNGLLDRWSGLASIGRRQGYLDRTCVDGLEFFGSLDLARRGYAEVEGILMPEVTGEPRSRLESVLPGRGLLRLGEQSVYLQLWPRETARHWRLLSAIAREAGAWWYGSGLDLLDDPLTASRLLGEIDQSSPRRRA